MAKRKMVLANLIKNSVNAYFAAIEIHNKPNISYRYETVTLLLVNAWELALKAYVKKYIKSRSIFTTDGHTISMDKALAYVSEHINKQSKGAFSAIKENLILIEDYRNNTTHFYCEALEPYIFMLVARAALNFVDFIEEYFGKDIMKDSGLFIIPLGFKLPFRPEEFLSRNVAEYASSDVTQEFIGKIVRVIEDLQRDGVEDSVVLGFELYLENAKKVKNSDIIAAVTTKESADLTITKTRKVRFSDEASQVVNMNDSEFRETWKYTHSDLVEWCKNNVKSFKQGPLFHEAKKSVEGDQNCVYMRRLDEQNRKSPSQKFYTDYGLKRIKEFYENNYK